MDSSILAHRLKPEEKLQFEEEGYLVVPDAVPSSVVDELSIAADRIARAEQLAQALEAHTRLNVHDTIGKENSLLKLIDWPATFLKVVEIMGTNIQLFHTQLLYTPPVPAELWQDKPDRGWHRDNNSMNWDFETEVHPRVSLKVLYFLSDARVQNSANLFIVPRSHKWLRSELSYGAHGDPPGAMPVSVAPGSALFFDRRMWHAASENRSQVTRKILVYGYSYRWLRPKCAMNVEHLFERCDPIQRQLLCASTAQGSYFDPSDRDVPLRVWVRENLH
jgi:ectoine hydroxylase-related dioxygenase (phytanoyl-CoA dioxygenase family)